MAESADTLTAEELAARADTTAEHIRDLVDAGLLQPEPDGRHRIGDFQRIRIFDALARSGISLDALARAARGGTISLTYYDRLHPPPGVPSSTTYGELRRDLGERDALLGRLYAAFGLAAPEPRSRLEQADEELLLGLLEIIVATGAPELALRVIRLLGDAIRRASDAVIGVYDEAGSRVFEAAEGLPPREAFERYLEAWMRLTRIAPDLGRWLTARHLSNAIDAWCVGGTEHYLALAGYVPPPSEAPPAVAFVDLSGFTRLAEERGDEEAARIALDFAGLAERHAADHEGRLVKVLGDGVLLRFPSVETGVEATLTLLGALPEAGLPQGHAGIDAGPIVVRDGDVFGRTVNLASRIAEVAEPGILLAPASVAAALPAEQYFVFPVGAPSLAGVAEPVELVRIGPP
jgi:adenylate cyclase